MDLELRDDFKTNLKQLNLRTNKKLNCQQTIAIGVLFCYTQGLSTCMQAS